MIRTILKPDYDRLDLSEIRINISDLPDGLKKYSVNRVGIIPIVHINTQVIEQADIEFLKINSDEFVPTFSIMFNDTNGIFMDEGIPFDDYKISIYIKSENSNLKSIRMDFKITHFKKVDNKKATRDGDALMNYYKVNGSLDMNYLYICETVAFRNQTSFQVLQTMCKDSGLGFASNISDTNDQMTWINPNAKRSDFIKKVSKKSYLSDSSFFYVAIDYHYQLYFIDVEKEFREDITKYQQVLNALFQEEHDFPLLNQNNKQETTNIPILSNDESFEFGTGFFNTYKVLNNSTNISLEDGYLKRIQYYDTVGNAQEGTGYRHDYTLDSNITPGSERTSVILKGRPGDDRFYKSHVRTFYGGHIDGQNTHENYGISEMINQINLTDMYKLGMKIYITKPNYNLYKFQKVVIYLNSSIGMVDSYPNKYLSGIWLITSINFKYQDSKLTQEIMLVKREVEPLL